MTVRVKDINYRLCKKEITILMQWQQLKSDKFYQIIDNYRQDIFGDRDG